MRSWRSCAACRRAASSSITARSSTSRRSRSPRSPPSRCRCWSAGMARRRAARDADGWLHGGGKPADLPGLLSRLSELRREHGTAGRPFEVHVISAEAYSLDGIKKLADQGVTEVIVGFRWPYHTGPDTEELQPKLDSLRRYADDIIAQAS